MKKILAMLLASSMILSFAACGDKPEETTTGETTTAETTTAETTVTPVAEEALDLFGDIWSAYLADTSIPEEEKLTYISGGDYNWSMDKMTEFETNNPEASDEEWAAFYESLNAPGNVAPEYDEENNNYLASISFPVEHVGLIDSAASAYHGMMLNNFTGAVYHVADSANVDTLVNALKTSLASTQWICGQPEVYTIITVDNFVISLYGLEMITDDLTAVIEGLYENATVICKEAVM